MGHNVTSKELKIYKAIYIALIVFSVITVLASYLPVGVALGVIIALIIATFKASLVAGYFMHLKEEKPIILWTMGFTLFFALCLIFLLVVGQYNLYEGSHYIIPSAGEANVTESVSHSVH